MIGKLITDAARVCELAHQGKAIYHVRWKRPASAAFLQNMQTWMIVNFIKLKWLYEYSPNPKKSYEKSNKGSKTSSKKVDRKTE